jgi:RNA polymerase sigma-70 factor (ECF subfamily)
VDFLEQYPPSSRLSGERGEGRPREDHLESLTDAELVALSQGGDVGAFNQLATRWESSLYGFVRRTLGNGEEARDVCQEALVKAWTNIAKLRDGGKFKSWVHYIALNLCRDRFRSPRSKAEVLAFDEEGQEPEDGLAAGSAAEAADASAERSSLSGVLESVLAELPPEQRTAILLREFQGFTSDEIGEMTGAPAATVRTRIYYGLRTLRKVLRSRGISPGDL